MTEILHKAKRKDNGDWVFGYYCRVGDTGKEKDYIIPSYASAFYGVEIDIETLCRFTGLTDKSSVKIFEGDIVSFTTIRFDGTERQHEGVVYWCDGAYWVDCTEMEGEEGIYLFGEVKILDDEFEVLSSIHDKEDT